MISPIENVRPTVRGLGIPTIQLRGIIVQQKSHVSLQPLVHHLCLFLFIMGHSNITRPGAELWSSGMSILIDIILPTCGSEFNGTLARDGGFRMTKLSHKVACSLLVVNSTPS